MLKKIIYGLALTWLVYGCYVTSYPLQEEQTSLLTSDEMQEDLLQLIHELSDKHAGLFRYQPKTQWTKKLQQCKQRLNEDKSLIEFYQEISQLIASIRCGHTKVSLPQHFLDDYLHKKTFFPLELKLIDRQIFIQKSFPKTDSLPKGSQILSINGKKPAEIIQALMSYTSTLSDGYNQTGKLRFIEQHFAFLYATFLDSSGSFQLVYQTPYNTEKEQITLEGIQLSGLYQSHQPSFPLHFTILTDANTAILKLSSFDQSSFKEHQVILKDTLQSVFGKLKQLKLKNLILDLRGNLGGDDSQVVLFLSYLMPVPFKVYEKIETNASYQSFGRVIRNKNTRPQLRDLPGLDSLAPQSLSFRGTLYTLINGMTFSGAADAAAILASQQRSKIYGEESGGAYQGNNSGIMPSVQLKNSGLSIRIPLWQYTNAVKKTSNHQGGVIPDYPIQQNHKDFLDDVDSVLKAVIQEINQL